MRKKPGPRPRGYIKLLVNIPVAHVEMMKWKNEQRGGTLSVNEQIRRAVRNALCGQVYINLVNH